MKFVDLSGQRFGKLTVIQRVQNRQYKCGQVSSQFLCKCDCGNEIIALSGNLRSGHTTSCGCVKAQLTSERSTTHGMSATPIYRVWNTMRQRCTNPKTKKYKDYGARGIKVCDEWQDSFESFCEYVSHLPHFGEKGYTLDRIDNDGHYEPGNVRWATNKEQNNNRRSRRKE